MECLIKRFIHGDRKLYKYNYEKRELPCRMNGTTMEEKSWEGYISIEQWGRMNQEKLFKER